MTAERLLLGPGPSAVSARVMRAMGSPVLSHLDPEMMVVKEIVDAATRVDALTVVDAVTSFAAMPLWTDAWGIDVCYSCSQKGLGAPSGLAPVSFSARARKKVRSRSFYLDLALLEDYFIRRKYHHTISAPLVYAVHEAVVVVGEDGLEARWARHEQNHRALANVLLFLAALERVLSAAGYRAPAATAAAAAEAAARS